MARADCCGLQFVALRMADVCDFQNKFGAVTEIDIENRGIRQRRADMIITRSLKTARQKHCEIVAAVILNIVLQLAQARDKRRLLVVFLSRGGRPSMRLGSQGCFEIIYGDLHRLKIYGRQRESRVVGQAADHGAAGGPSTSTDMFLNPSAILMYRSIVVAPCIWFWL
jgi:hypothetical protein